jgi:competence protein ComGC
MSKGRVVQDFFRFIRHEKKYWLAPLVIVILVLSLLIVFSQSSVIGPFIYTLF